MYVGIDQNLLLYTLSFLVGWTSIKSAILMWRGGVQGDLTHPHITSRYFNEINQVTSPLATVKGYHCTKGGRHVDDMGSQPYIYNICWRFNHQILGDVFWDIELSKGGTPQMARKNIMVLLITLVFCLNSMVSWGHVGTCCVGISWDRPGAVRCYVLIRTCLHFDRRR